MHAWLTGTASSHREGPAGPKRKAGPAAPPEPPPEPPVQVQLSAQVLPLRHDPNPPHASVELCQSESALPAGNHQPHYSVLRTVHPCFNTFRLMSLLQFYIQHFTTNKVSYFFIGYL